MLMPKLPQSRHTAFSQRRHYTEEMYRCDLSHNQEKSGHFTDRLPQKEQKDVLYVLEQNLQPIWPH